MLKTRRRGASLSGLSAVDSTFQVMDFRIVAILGFLVMFATPALLSLVVFRRATGKYRRGYFVASLLAGWFGFVGSMVVYAGQRAEEVSAEEGSGQPEAPRPEE